MTTIEDLLREEAEKLGVAPQVEEETDSPPADDNLLDSLLSESMLAYQANIKAKKGQRLTKTEALVLETNNLERDWKVLGLVGLVESQTCLCGASHSTFIGWYGILQHRNDYSAKRIYRVESMLEPISFLSAPTRQHTITKAVDVCGKCLNFPEATEEEASAWGLATLK